MNGIRKNNLPLNLEVITCPKCGEIQDTLRLPESVNQAINGGCNCKKCGTVMDKYGKEIKTKS